MAEPHAGSVKVSPVAARLIREAGKEDKLRGARGQIPLSPLDFLTVLLFFCGSADAEVKGAALAALRKLSPEVVTECLCSPDIHPRHLDLLARAKWSDGSVATRIFSHPATSAETMTFLRSKGVVPASHPEEPVVEEMEEPAREPEPDESPDQPDCGDDGNEEDDEPDPESEEFKSKYQLVLGMGVSDKIKMALTGDKEWRTLLIKDANKLVSGAVVKNPRITDGEILTIAKSNIQNDEIVRVICANKDWMKVYAIKKAMVENHKTPLAVALRQMNFLTDKDLASLGKSKNVSSVISTAAKKTLLGRKKK